MISDSRVVNRVKFLTSFNFLTLSRLLSSSHSSDGEMTWKTFQDWGWPQPNYHRLHGYLITEQLKFKFNLETSN
jgi:hypothetical protein